MIHFKKEAAGAILILLTIALSLNVYSDIIINEVMYEPNTSLQGDDSDLEWVEIFNNGTTTVDLSSWQLEENNFGNVNISPGDYIVIARELIDGSDSDINSFEAYYGNNDSVWNSTDAEFRAVDGSFGASLLANGELINLSNGTTTQSAVNYSQFASLNFGKNNGKTLILYRGNFTESAFVNGTPGASNDQFAPDLNKWVNPGSNGSAISVALNITINITDATGVSSAIVNFNSTNFSMSQNNDLWYYLWDTSPNIGQQANITVFFNDSLGASGTDSLFNLTIATPNRAPVINITINNEYANATSVNETQKVNITLNASDPDNNTLTFSINDSRFMLNTIYFIWSTNLSDSGDYVINITVNDSLLTDSRLITVTVLDARDTDNDNNPDFSDTDDDNDGISDSEDFLTGNLSNINTTLIINIAVNGTANLSKPFNGTFFFNITNGTMPLVEFNWTFNTSNVLDLAKITINRTSNSTSAIFIKGINMTKTGFTKTVFLEKINSGVNSVCIKDEEVSYDSISNGCNSGNEILIICNNLTSGGYACYDTGSMYKLTGLRYSAIKEQCGDADGDGYGTGCSAGSDCNDNDASKSTDCSNPASPAPTASGSGSGAGFLGYLCDLKWECGEWSTCMNKKQSRKCIAIKIDNYISAEKCAQMPEQERSCSTKEIKETCSDKTRNQGETGTDCGGPCSNPCFKIEIKAEEKADNSVKNTAFGPAAVATPKEKPNYRNVFNFFAAAAALSSMLFLTAILKQTFIKQANYKGTTKPSINKNIKMAKFK